MHIPWVTNYNHCFPFHSFFSSIMCLVKLPFYFVSTAQKVSIFSVVRTVHSSFSWAPSAIPCLGKLEVSSFSIVRDPLPYSGHSTIQRFENECSSHLNWLLFRWADINNIWQWTNFSILLLPNPFPVATHFVCLSLANSHVKSYLIFLSIVLSFRCIFCWNSVITSVYDMLTKMYIF